METETEWKRRKILPRTTVQISYKCMMSLPKSKLTAAFCDL